MTGGATISCRRTKGENIVIMKRTHVDNCKVSPKYLLFDLGHVLVELQGMHWLRRHWGDGAADAIQRRWLNFTLVRDFECGRSDSQPFFAGMSAALGAGLTPAEFEEAFDSWVVGPFEGAEEMLVELRKKNYRLGCLSNTNPNHIAKLEHGWKLLDLFDHRFYSHQLGCMKPDFLIYRQVQEQLGLAAQDICFFDDNPENCAAAMQATGWQTRCVSGWPAVDAAVREIIATAAVD